MKTPDFSKIHWDAPGFGEVYSPCRKWSILCCAEKPDEEDIFNDALAAYVMKALKAYVSSARNKAGES